MGNFNTDYGIAYLQLQRVCVGIWQAQIALAPEIRFSAAYQSNDLNLVYMIGFIILCCCIIRHLEISLNRCHEGTQVQVML